MMADKLYYPKNVAVRSATTDNKRNGDFVNPPTYPEMGGFKPSSVTKSKVTMPKPGPGKKIV